MLYCYSDFVIYNINIKLLFLSSVFLSKDRGAIISQFRVWPFSPTTIMNR